MTLLMSQLLKPEGNDALSYSECGLVYFNCTHVLALSCPLSVFRESNACNQACVIYMPAVNELRQVTACTVCRSVNPISFKFIYINFFPKKHLIHVSNIS